MKKLLLILLFLPFVFSACGDDEDKDKPASELIVGTWQFAKMEPGEIIVNPATLKPAIEEELKNADFGDMDTKMTFDANGNYSGVDESGTPSTGKYTIKGNMLVVDGQDFGQINFSGDNQFHIHLDLTDMIREDLPDNSGITITKITVKLTFMRK